MTSALASLTATYTDSEGEEDESGEGNEDTKSIETVPKSPNSSTPDNKSTHSSQPASPVPIKVTTKVRKLVSYHDDTIASDDDGESEEVPHQVIMMSDNEQGDSEISRDDGITIPPEPPGHCSQELQEKITKLYEKMQTQQLDMNAVIHKRKDFRNPSIYEKLIQFCDLDELGKKINAKHYLEYQFKYFSLKWLLKQWIVSNTAWKRNRKYFLPLTF